MKKIGRKRALYLCAALMLIICVLAGCGEKKEQAPIPAATNAQRLSYLGERGWQVDPEPLETLALQLPHELEQDYSDYVKLQAGQGFPFAQCAGQTASRYTYQVNNYPGYDGPVQINLWVCGGVLVGGDVIAPGEGGFQAGLAFPK